MVDNINVLHPDAIKALHENLLPNEKIEIIIEGLGNSAMVATNRRVFVFKKGVSSGLWFGYKLTSWDYRNLVGVELETGLITGFVALQGPGIDGKDVSASLWGSGNNDVWKLPSAIPIGQTQMEPASQNVAKLRQLITNYQNIGQTTGSISDLEKLAELRDKGIVTEEEFQAKKKQILGLPEETSKSLMITKCPICGWECNTQESLETHVKYVHSLR